MKRITLTEIGWIAFVLIIFAAFLYPRLAREKSKTIEPVISGSDTLNFRPTGRACHGYWTRIRRHGNLIDTFVIDTIYDGMPMPTTITMRDSITGKFFVARVYGGKKWISLHDSLGGHRFFDSWDVDPDSSLTDYPTRKKEVDSL